MKLSNLIKRERRRVDRRFALDNPFKLEVKIAPTVLVGPINPNPTAPIPLPSPDPILPPFPDPLPEGGPAVVNY